MTAETQKNRGPAPAHCQPATIALQNWSSVIHLSSNMYLWYKLQWCSALSFRLQAASCLGHLMLESPDLWQDLERFPRCFTLQRHNRFQHHDHHIIYICGILLFTYTLHSYLLFYVFFNIYFVFKSQRHSLRVCVFISQEKISTLPQACKALL